MSEQKADLLESEIDTLEETLLQVSAHKRLIISPSGSVLVVYSRRDLVRMHKAKSRAILKAERLERAEKTSRAERLGRAAQNESQAG